MKKENIVSYTPKQIKAIKGQTDFKKLTKYPIQKTKYFDLRRVLNLTELPEVEEIAEMLRTKDW